MNRLWGWLGVLEGKNTKPKNPYNEDQDEAEMLSSTQ